MPVGGIWVCQCPHPEPVEGWGGCGAGTVALRQAQDEGLGSTLRLVHSPFCPDLIRASMRCGRYRMDPRVKPEGEGRETCHLLSLFLRPIHNVIPAQAGIQQRAVLPAGFVFCTADAVHWIPACAGMTMGVGENAVAVIARTPNPPSGQRPTVSINRRHETVHGPSES